MKINEAIKAVYRGAMGEDSLRPPLILKHLHLNKDWTDSEKTEFIEEFWAYTNNPHKSVEVWREIFSFYPKVDETRKKYPVSENLTVFRGGNNAGFSWTSSFEQAEFFLARNLELGFSNCFLWKGIVKSEGVLFETEVRDEMELVLKFWDDTIWYEKPFKVDI